MELLFLMKFIGAFLVIYGLIAMLRKQVLMPAVAEMAESRALLLLFATIELLLGLALVFAYPTVSMTWSGVVSVVGYLLVLEAVLYLAFPKKLMQPVIQMVNRPAWYTVGGAFSIVVGVAMFGAAFGWW